MSATPPRTAVVIANPAARRALSARALDAAASAMRARGWDVAIEVATSRDDTIARAERHARAGVDALVACGGDGTLLAVVNGVRAAGNKVRTAVGAIPAGTANVWAAEAGVPRDPMRALALLENGERQRIDVGIARIGDGAAVRFLIVCGAGLDAAVVRSVEDRPGWKRRIGRLAFGAPALRALASWPAIDTRLSLDGLEVQAPHLLLALASNTSRYGGVTALSRTSQFDDGLLEVVTFEGGRSLPGRVALALHALRGHLDTRDVRGVTHRQASLVTLTPAHPMPIEVDGDAIGECGPDAPLHIEVEHRALTMILGPVATRSA